MCFYAFVVVVMVVVVAVVMLVDDPVRNDRCSCPYVDVHPIEVDVVLLC
jgi:hypothetical protein